jgi:hypothetical protein
MRRKIVLCLATIGLLFTAFPAFSQVGVGVGPGGVDVRVGDRDRDYRRDRAYGRGRGRGCRTIIERHRRWDGTVVTRRIERC